ncbi:MAG: DUF2892 domain-containing protein [Armatimonadota bacterium]|nr:DUF2892 domain-containing protein [Armatimonadota bacterium]MDR7402204.1 DUF2892 domain-containing protein [Armatimonadota bacterium]MDR7403332.1 DUF2892 domain-containing protein [Armatimonadota bacterium]MDR7436960.1 DUF2892 domain-containing protein [Armatimonadota bacterium]MDR7472266.1 DUF2892 domain-containing protein [Armatimonadota bacterium]
MRGCVGTTDRVLRVLIGIAALIWALVTRGQMAAGWTYVLYLIAAIGLITGLAGRCPLYVALGVQTCGTARKQT